MEQQTKREWLFSNPSPNSEDYYNPRAVKTIDERKYVSPFESEVGDVLGGAEAEDSRSIESITDSLKGFSINLEDILVIKIASFERRLESLEDEKDNIVSEISNLNKFTRLVENGTNDENESFQSFLSTKKADLKNQIDLKQEELSEKTWEIKMCVANVDVYKDYLYEAHELSDSIDYKEGIKKLKEEKRGLFDKYEVDASFEKENFLAEARSIDLRIEALERNKTDLVSGTEIDRLKKIESGLLEIATKSAIMEYREETVEKGDKNFAKKTEAVVKSGLWSSVISGVKKGWSKGESFLGKITGAIGGAGEGYDEYKKAKQEESNEKTFVNDVRTHSVDGKNN